MASNQVPYTTRLVQAELNPVYCQLSSDEFDLLCQSSQVNFERYCIQSLVLFTTFALNALRDLFNLPPAPSPNNWPFPAFLVINGIGAVASLVTAVFFLIQWKTTSDPRADLIRKIKNRPIYAVSFLNTSGSATDSLIPPITTST